MTSETSGTGEPHDRKPATMRDIARQLGLSRTTVSLVLNNQQTRIPESTKELIRRTAKELNYRPSVVARELRLQTSSLVGFVGDAIATGPFGGGLIAGAQAAVTENGQVLLLLNTGTEGDLVSAPLEVLLDRGVTGLILATVLTREVELPEVEWAERVVLLNCFNRDERFPSVLPDDFGGAQEAAAHVAELGHKRIAYIGGDDRSVPTRQRIAGTRMGLARHEIDLRDDFVVASGWHADSGYEAAGRLLEREDRPTAILCGNDRVALGVFERAQSMGLSVPGDLSVVGFDDQDEIAAYTHPALTTVRLPYMEMGERAGQLLAAGGDVAIDTTVACHLVVRESTAPPAG